MADGFGACLEQAAECGRLGYRYHDGGAAVGGDAGMARQVLADLGHAGRRIDGHRRAAGYQHAEEADEVVAPGRQHQHHRLARYQPPVEQAGREPGGGLAQGVVGQYFAVAVVGIEADVRSVGVGRRVPVEGLDQGPGADGQGLDAAEIDRFDLARGGGLLLSRGGGQGAQQIARGFGLSQHRFRQGGAEGGLDPGDEFDPAQTVEAEIAVENGIEGDLHGVAARGPQFGKQAGNHLDQAGGRYGSARFRRSVAVCRHALRTLGFPYGII